MALLGKKDRADDGESAASAKGVSSRLRTLEEHRFSGAVEVTVKGSNAQAQIYFYEGGIYAVHLDGYGPVLMDRLLTDGVLDGPRWTELAAIFGPHRSDPRVGPTAVEQEWMTVDELVNLHQELLIASLGAVLAVPKARIDRETSATTGGFCSLPQDVPRLMRLVQGRQQRTAGAWAAMEARCEPGELVLRRGTALPPSNLDRDEFRAIVDLVDGQRALDEIAASLGLTRGEATRAASLLVLAGALGREDDVRAVAPRDRLLVPEAWGVSLEPRHEPAWRPAQPAGPVAAAPVRVEPAPPGPFASAPVEPVPVLAEPVPVLAESVEPVLADLAGSRMPEQADVPVEPVAVSTPLVVPVPPAQDGLDTRDLPEPPVAVPATAEPELVPEPEPVPEPAEPEPAVDYRPEPVPPPVPDRTPPPAPTEAAVPPPVDRQRTLQEATAEAVRLEQLLSESIAAEQEALARSAVIRERLRDTLARVAGLTGPVPGDDVTSEPGGPS